MEVQRLGVGDEAAASASGARDGTMPVPPATHALRSIVD